MKIILLILSLGVMAIPKTISNVPQSDKQKWQRLAEEVSLVLVAEVVEVKPSPGFWSGHIAAIQHVRYKPVKVLKGDFASPNLEVEYYVVSNSPLADKKQARLSPAIFKVGNQLILFLESDLKKEDAYFKVNRNRGAVEADTDLIKALSNLNSKER